MKILEVTDPNHPHRDIAEQLFAEIVRNGDLDHFNRFVEALPDWTESGTEDAFNLLIRLLPPVIRYTQQVIRPNLTKLYIGTDRVPNPTIGMVLPRPPGEFHHWTSELQVAKHFATLSARNTSHYANGCVGEVQALGVVVDVFNLTGALMEMPDLPYNRQYGTRQWQGGWLEDEIITYRNTAPCRVIWTTKQP